MGRLNSGKNHWRLGVATLVLGATAAVVLWVERKPLLARYYVYRLSQASEVTRNLWAERIMALDTDALPPLLRCLKNEDSPACRNALDVLARLTRRFDIDEAKRLALADQLANGFAERSPSAQQLVLDLAALLVRPSGQAGPVPAGLVPAAGRLVETAVQADDKRVRAKTLALAALLLSPGEQPAVVASCQEAIHACLHDPEPENRIRALNLAGHPHVNLVDQAVPLLRDPVPEVRRAAMLALGPAPEMVATDDLLHWLHDSDAKVRTLCETALRGRGLREDHLRLGRLITDPQPKVRLQVPENLHRTQELDPGVWLRRLSHDPVPAVRAAAIRSATEQPMVDLRDRIEQMVQNDPSPTVRQVARYYLSCRSSKQPPTRK
jgi:HEAT repeat protein